MQGALDEENNVLKVSQGFCVDFMKTFNTYLNWRFNSFRKIASVLNNYSKCFKTDGNFWNSAQAEEDSFNRLFPKVTNDLLKCMETTDYDTCASSCQEIKLSGYSKFFDGNKRSLSTFYNDLINILRMQGIIYGEKILTEADELKKEEEEALA